MCGGREKGGLLGPASREELASSSFTLYQGSEEEIENSELLTFSLAFVLGYELSPHMCIYVMYTHKKGMCISYFSIAMIKHHGQATYRRKGLFGAYSSEGEEYMAIMVGVTAAGR